AKSAFLANMSHELRTPLNAVLGFAQVLQHDTSLNAEQKQQVDTIKRSGDYLLTLINDVLDLAKIEAGRLDLIPSSCEIDSFFRELAHLFQSRAKDKNIDFRYEPTDTLPYYVEVDEKRLRQICMNLLSNAVKFTEKGEVRLEVDYRRTEPVLKNCPLCGELTIWVSDTGIGIPMEEQASVFKPFQQAGENEYKQQGTGLGLPITQNLVEQMGGQIKLESDIEQGSCFIVQIPVPELEAANPMNPKTALTMATGYQRTDGIQTPLRILEADDVPLNRALVRGLLEPLGFEVTEVESGAEAVAITEQQTFDLIIMDLVMPEMDGLTATRQILARSSEVNRYIVALTARAFDENRIECLQAGCCEHLSKPLETERLLQVLQTFLPLEWVYHNQQVTTATDISIPDDSSCAIPMETLDALEDALIRGAVDEIETLLEPIKSQDNTLGVTLQQWLEQYEYQKMLDWIEANKSVSPVTALSIETLNTLENALIRGAVDEVETLLESVKTQDTKLATTLQQWLEQYEYQKMLDWIETMKQ
ncbi:ATP-binding protein, partial [Candidatus Albibeggiatoa sp. nov. NOAA]|uniref:ATP-binding protein n=1 Tax=Candidatus Albibeggiatoa sp. nov. NOAA TaxID=3162724 RepID=UPI0033018559|nr:ATP-binding protein [Thiotrichaceae bacterium]